MGLYDFTFHDVIERNGVTFGEKPAWVEVEEGRTITFGQCRDLVRRLASGLQKAGLAPGDRVGILAKNSFDYFLVYGAAAALGLIAVPINWRLSPDEVRFNLKDVEPRAVFADKEHAPLLQDLRGSLPGVKNCFGLGEGVEGFPGVHSLLENKGDFKPVPVSSDDGFVIIHTAAVAGRPRGALLSHRNVLLANMHLAYFLNVKPADVHLNFLPLFHVGGMFMVTAGFQAGALNLNLKKFDPMRSAELIQEEKVSFMMVFSPILASILEKAAARGLDVSSLRAVTGIDTPETIEKYQKATGGLFFSMYGQTETSCLATFGPYNDRPGSAGRMLPMAEVRVVDEEDRPLPVRQVGEITMRGPMVFKGYWNLPGETAYSFRGGWHHTGDLGRFDEDGFLWYAGRKPEKELIKPGGENVYPAEVENIILQHPAVEKAVVFGVPDPTWKEAIKAVCQLKAGKSLEPRELIDFVGERIARYKKPADVEFVNELPLLENGSIDRGKVKTTYGGGV